MSAYDNRIKQIKTNFENAINLQQSCKIYICNVKNDSWSFYFKKGNLVWASSSNHRFRRLYRSIDRFCPEVNCQDVELREQEFSELWEYLFINVLYKRNKIDKAQTKNIIQAAIEEVLFDCFIDNQPSDRVKVIFATKGNQMGAILNSVLFNTSIAHLNYAKNIDRLRSLTSSWKNFENTAFSPNTAPVIKNIDKLKKAVNDFDIYQQLFIYIDGNKTIRDLAVVSKRGLLVVAKQLLPHIESKAIALQEIPDLQLTNLYFSPSNQEVNIEYVARNREYIREINLPLVICVDRDPQICQHITQLLNPIGYRVISVNNAAKTLIVLLENKPNLIFIDAHLPDVNGYELCSQIKKMTAFKDTSIILLNKSQGLIDRFRQKVSGAIDLVEKPLNSMEILTLTQKFTQNFVEHQIAAVNSDMLSKGSRR